ncbi:MAG: shikimate dehydrogenase [Gemmatimonadetes bacterium]|nr:shikimate dehydrogenase [Gemmatimonadota bacterium]
MRKLPGRLVLLGHPVAHSLSPRFQNAALRAADIPLVYEAIDVPPQSLRRTLAELAEIDAIGNVTIPHKEDVAACCHRLLPLAQRCGAVNTFWHEDGQLVGDNTDVGGVDAIATLLLGEARHGATVTLLGAGGSAAAVVAAVERWGDARVRLYNRNVDRARLLAARFGPVVDVVDSVEEALEGAALVVNATPVGLKDDAFPVPVGALPGGAAVFDLVYRANETAWVRAAREAGHRAADGEGMLVEQGALSFERWFGVVPDRGAMWRALH